MPGELGNEFESQQTGYYEHRFQPQSQVMDDNRFVQEEEDSKKLQTQQERLIKRWKRKLYVEDPEHSNLPDGGPSPGKI
jgi:hypothetical protein